MQEGRSLRLESTGRSLVTLEHWLHLTTRICSWKDNTFVKQFESCPFAVVAVAQTSSEAPSVLSAICVSVLL